jgi:hypothetical protein
MPCLPGVAGKCADQQVLLCLADCTGPGHPVSQALHSKMLGWT